MGHPPADPPADFQQPIGPSTCTSRCSHLLKGIPSPQVETRAKEWWRCLPKTCILLFLLKFLIFEFFLIFYVKSNENDLQSGFTSEKTVTQAETYRRSPATAPKTDGHAYGVVKHTRPPDSNDSGSHNQIERNISVRPGRTHEKGIARL